MPRRGGSTPPIVGGGALEGVLVKNGQLILKSNKLKQSTMHI
jgi:hypothetical protein